MTIKASYPTIEPTLSLDFANSKRLDPRVTFTRNSVGTYFDAAGVLRTAAVNEPRFDHDPATGESLGLLVEEARANLFLRSEEFGTTWGYGRSTLSANAISSPSLELTADKIIEDTTPSNSHYVYQTASVTTGLSYTVSAYVKAAERTSIGITFFSTNSAFASAICLFNLSNGTITDSTQVESASIAPVGNGWYRISATKTATATATATLAFFLIFGTNTQAYTGDGTSGLYLWGAQLEAGAFPTSYIKTEGSTVTRQADTAVMTGTNFSSWYRQSEGSLLVEALPKSTQGSGIVGFDDTTASERWRVGHSGTTASVLVLVDGGAVQASLQSAANTWPVSTVGRIAGAVALNDSNFSTNGSAVITDSSCTVPTVSQMTIGVANSVSPINGTIRSIRYWNTRLPNATLQALTAS